MPSQTRWSVLAVLLALVFVGWIAGSEASAVYQIDGQIHTSPTVQLWYEGLWKDLDTVSGTVTHHPSDFTAGNILIVKSAPFPYDELLRELAKKRPLAVIMVQNRRGVAGDGMFYVDGKDRSTINFPVAESHSNDTQDLADVPEGAFMTVQFEKNRWKAVKLDTKFQAVCGALLSLWEISTLLLGLWRLYQFWLQASTSWLSIGPICLSLELVAVAIRLALTLVDPFWTYRMLPAGAGNALFTLHFPFALSSGILLTFYWAETLNTTKIKATPFVSDYRIVAIVVCILLFIVEAVVDYFRITKTNSRFSPIIITIVFYVIVSAVLTVCYVICAVSIMQRIKSMNMGSSRADRIKKMSLRFTLSSAGYIATILLEILTYIVSGIPWAPQICYNLLYASLAWTAMLQIWALKPFKPKTPSGTVSKSDTGSQALQTI